MKGLWLEDGVMEGRLGTEYIPHAGILGLVIGVTKGRFDGDYGVGRTTRRALGGDDADGKEGGIGSR